MSQDRESLPGEQPEIESDELEESSLDEVSGGLSTGLETGPATTSPTTESLSQLNKQAVKSFQCDLSPKG